GCYLALRLAMKPSTSPAGCLEVRHGCYAIVDGATKYHPLESVLVGKGVLSSDWKLDAAATLGVSAAWMQGFLDGFAGQGEASADADYLQGYLAAEGLRQRHPRYFRLSLDT